MYYCCICFAAFCLLASVLRLVQSIWDLSLTGSNPASCHIARSWHCTIDEGDEDCRSYMVLSRKSVRSIDSICKEQVQLNVQTDVCSYNHPMNRRPNGRVITPPPHTKGHTPPSQPPSHLPLPPLGVGGGVNTHPFGRLFIEWWYEHSSF